eukprot:CAMPEP_0115145506 /NCGR_PEP_ID=MMETSP0227-20121206/62157_1 /TAXON_ID=89957 /ORGANISM="Polarella glacialis, Strain CCMP 1383" /LENGTH=51 /DNA_ID=CAMNT_0002555039 /DNA_START=109 /DNA_END=261 /DNA_ORIENTATION=-
MTSALFCFTSISAAFECFESSRGLTEQHKELLHEPMRALLGFNPGRGSRRT